MTKWKSYIIFAILLALMDIVFAFWMMNHFGDDIRQYVIKKQHQPLPIVKMNIQANPKVDKVKEREDHQKAVVRKEKKERSWEMLKDFIVDMETKVKDLFRWREKKAAAEERKKIDRLAADIKEQTKLSDHAISQIIQYKQKTGIPIKIVLAVIEQESNFNKDAVGTSQDRGLMQIIPDTEVWLCKKYGEAFGITYDPQRIFDEDYNIALGTIYLWHLYKAYPEDYDRILTEYNRGYYKAERYYKEKGTYATTYSQKVLEKMKKYEGIEMLESKEVE